MADEDEFAPVVPLFPDSDKLDHERPLHTKEKEYRGCFHHRTDLDGEAKRAYCRDCGVERPLWEVLEELARDPERYVSSRKALAREEKRLRERVEELKREERNAKSRIRKPKKAFALLNGEFLEAYCRRWGPINEENAKQAGERIARVLGVRGELDRAEEA